MKKIILILIVTIMSVQYAYAQSVDNQQPIKEGYPVYSLGDLYRIALERSERIKITEEDLYIAERGKDKTLSTLLPKLSAFGSYTRYTEDKLSSSGSIIQPEGSLSWGLRLDQTLSLSGREITAFKISKENIEKAGYDLYAVREGYLLDVSLSYYDVLRARRSLEIADANVERLIKHRDAAKVRLRVGEVTKTAVLRAEAELSGAQSDQIKAKNGLELSKAVLARVVGIEGKYELKETPDINQHKMDSKYADTIWALKQTAFAERAELKALELQKKMQEEQIGYAKGAYWPAFSLEGVYSRKDEDPASASLNRESIYGGIRINFPFFEGGLRKAEVREAEARHRQSALLYEDRKKAVNIEVENAYLELMTQEGITEKFRNQVAYAEDNYKAVSRQFEFGLANSIDVMDANTLLVTSERQMSDAQYNYQLSALRLKRATGVLLKTVGGYIK